MLWHNKKIIGGLKYIQYITELSITVMRKTFTSNPQYQYNMTSHAYKWSMWKTSLRKHTALQSNQTTIWRSIYYAIDITLYICNTFQIWVLQVLQAFTYVKMLSHTLKSKCLFPIIDIPYASVHFNNTTKIDPF